MSKGVLDADGLLYLWSKIKAGFTGVHNALGTKADYEAVDAGFTGVYNALDTKVDAEDGKGLSTNDFTDEYKAKLDQAKTTVAWDDVTGKPDLTTVYRYKGSVATFGDLPTDVEEGWVYNVETDDMNYGWTGSKWDPLGSIFTITPITNAEIDAIVTGS